MRGEQGRICRRAKIRDDPLVCVCSSGRVSPKGEVEDRRVRRKVEQRRRISEKDMIVGPDECQGAREIG